MSSGSAHPTPEVFRLVPPLVFWWVWVAFAVANLADFAIQGTASARFTTMVTAILVTVTGFAYVLALRPKVIASETGITVVNPFRDHQIPWGMIQAVDTGDWVRVHYAPAAGAPGGKARSSVRTVYCWALYVSARTKRSSGRVAPRPRRAGLFRAPAGLGEEPGHGGQSRLPEQARYLASLPVSKAIAVRLDTRAGKDRAGPAEAGASEVTARWAWPAIMAAVVPALVLLIVALT